MCQISISGNTKSHQQPWRCHQDAISLHTFCWTKHWHHDSNIQGDCFMTVSWQHHHGPMASCSSWRFLTPSWQQYSLQCDWFITASGQFLTALSMTPYLYYNRKQNFTNLTDLSSSIYFKFTLITAHCKTLVLEQFPVCISTVPVFCMLLMCCIWLNKQWLFQY